MIGPHCRPLPELSVVPGLRDDWDRWAELLECLADLRVEARRQRTALSEHEASNDVGVVRAIERLSALERRVVDVGAEAAYLYQDLQRLHLI